MRVVLCTCGVLLVALAGYAWFGPRPESGATRDPLHDGPPTRPLVARHAAAGPARREVAAPAIERPLTFEAVVDALVDLTVAAQAALDLDDEEVAREHDAEARHLVAELRDHVEGWDERALAAFGELIDEDTTARGVARREVLLTLVELGIRWRWSRFRTSGQRDAADRYTEMIARSIPLDERAGRPLAFRILADEPFLGAAHEPAVLELVEASRSEPWLVEIATALLGTLWRNLERDGHRASNELAGLALLFLDDANPVRRDVALQHLLTADGGKYRHLALERALTLGDVGLASRLALAAARDLPPAEALDVIERLVVTGDAYRFTGAFLTLGERDPFVLRQAYEDKLGTLTAPHVRAELVTGAGFCRTGALDLAQLAFEQDPDGDVRTRALFVLSAEASPAIAEQSLLRAIDDPTFADRPARLGAVVAALRNMAPSSPVNTIDRIAARLRAHPQLGDLDRRALDDLVAKYVPARGG